MIKPLQVWPESDDIDFNKTPSFTITTLSNQCVPGVIDSPCLGDQARVFMQKFEVFEFEEFEVLTQRGEV